MNIPEEVFNSLPREVKVYISKLEYDLWHDKLTGVMARQPFLEICQNELAHVNRGCSKGFALLFIDVDNFKNVNDIHGHQTGDAVLIDIATVLRKNIRTEDSVARYGGDEFTLLMRDATTKEEVLAAVRRIEENFKSITDTQKLGIGLSIGAVFATSEEHDIQTLLHEADTLMYAAKRKEGFGSIKVEVVERV